VYIPVIATFFEKIATNATEEVVFEDVTDAAKPITEDTRSLDVANCMDGMDRLAIVNIILYITELEGSWRENATCC
jgi:hypothetical protein